MIYRQLLEVIVVLLGSVFGEKVDDLCVEREQTLVNGEAYRHGGEALADRIHRVRRFLAVGVAVALIGYLAVPYQHKGVDLDIALIEVVDESFYLVAVNADLLGKGGSRYVFGYFLFCHNIISVSQKILFPQISI